MNGDEKSEGARAHTNTAKVAGIINLAYFRLQWAAVLLLQLIQVSIETDL